MSKEISAPAIIHSEKNGGFDKFFHEQCKKVEFSHNRVKVVTSPFLLNKEYISNYDYIDWTNSKKQLTKKL